MTGPGHYREAERLLIGTGSPETPETPVQAALRIATAQAHATLALAAATALTDPSAPTGEGIRCADQKAWRRVAATDYPEPAGGAS